MSESDGFLTHPALRPRHGFGTRGAPEPGAIWRATQVHGDSVAVIDAPPVVPLGEADAVVSSVPGVRVAVVTADCVPILAAEGAAVAAIHAGWRGLAAGVIEAALEALAAQQPHAAPATRAAVVGPHICARHYEIDAPVRDALRTHHEPVLADALRTTRPGHWELDLLAIARNAFRRAGWEASQVEVVRPFCTFEDSRRFASRRRDGPGRERLMHWIETPGARATLDTEPPRA